MAQSVTTRYRDIVYSGERLYTCSLSINNNAIDKEQISSITISRPIIDTTQDAFYLGTFISDKIEIDFKNINAIDIKSGYECDLSIALRVDVVDNNGYFKYLDNENNIYWYDSTNNKLYDNEYTEIEEFDILDYTRYYENEWVSQGKFIIDDLEENYQKSNKITCLDYAIKFEKAVDTSYEQIFDYNVSTDTYSISLEDLLSWLCTHYGVTLGTYPNVNRSVRVGNWDSTLSGKQYVSWIAEMMGGNAKIGRDGSLNIVPLKSNPVYTINALESESLEVGEKYSITKVTYYDAIRNYTYGNDTGNTLYIRQENMFVVDTTEIQNVYNAVNGFEVYSVTQSIWGDLSLDAYDIITLTTDIGVSYNVLNHGDITYNGAVKINRNPKIPTKQQEVATNITKVNDGYKSFRKAMTEIDQINGTITMITGETKQLNMAINGEYIYTLTTDETYQADTEYYQKVGDEYTLMVAGTDYTVGDTIPANTAYSRSYNEGLANALSDLSKKQGEDYTDLFNKFDDYATVDYVGSEVERTQTSTYSKEQINQIVSGTDVDGVTVTAVVSTEATFDKDGMHYSKTGANTVSTINYQGLTVSDKNDTTLLFAGVKNDQSVVTSENLNVKDFLVCGDNYGRFEIYKDPTANKTGVGFFILK